MDVLFKYHTICTLLNRIEYKVGVSNQTKQQSKETYSKMSTTKFKNVNRAMKPVNDLSKYNN